LYPLWKYSSCRWIFIFSDKWYKGF